MFWDPFEYLERMHEEMDKAFSSAFGGRKLLAHGKGDKAVAKKDWFRAPVCDVDETENNIIASFELPGADKEDIDLNVTDDMIEVKVDKKQEKEQKGKDKYVYASRSSSFYRSLPLPKNVQADKAEASYKNGMLKVKIPKAKLEKDKQKKIEIK